MIAYGVTTVPSRRECLLPLTLKSLSAAGFGRPRLFVDGGHEEQYWSLGLPLSCRNPKVGVYTNWLLGLVELIAREPLADNYLMLQDDVLAVRRLRSFLEGGLPDGYCNLYDVAGGPNGWHPSVRRGKGALALLFPRVLALRLLNSQRVWSHMCSGKFSDRNVDGQVFLAMEEAEVREFVHTPSLVQHTGGVSTLGNRHPPAHSFDEGLLERG